MVGLRRFDRGRTLKIAQGAPSTLWDWGLSGGGWGVRRGVARERKALTIRERLTSERKGPSSTPTAPNPFRDSGRLLGRSRGLLSGDPRLHQPDQLSLHFCGFCGPNARAREDGVGVGFASRRVKRPNCVRLQACDALIHYLALAGAHPDFALVGCRRFA